MKELAASVDFLSTSFSSSPRSVHESINYLQKFEKQLSAAFQPLAQAIKDDFNKPIFESYSCEYSEVLGELNYFIKNIKSMLACSSPESLSVAFSTLNTTIEKIALGTVLIISPFNYPLLLALSPFIGAFASGNNVVLKLPGDQLPRFSSALKMLMDSVFNGSEVLVVTGGVSESTELLNNCTFDKILFTGSTRVGRIVQEAAAKKLTPTVLELGGKSPAFVTKNSCVNSSLKTIAKRLLWGKFTNAGQTCVAPDYLLVDATISDEFITIIKEIYNEDYKNINSQTDFTHIINESSFSRISEYLEKTKGEILCGGSTEKSALFIQPTIVGNVDWDDVLMEDEIFGPVLPIIKYESLDKVISEVKNRHDTPLSMYILSSDKNDIKAIKQIRSGSICINETLMTAGCSSTPFGGIGTSGFGNYHSKWTVSTFTHERTVMEQPMWAEFLLKSRYFPYKDGNLTQLKLIGRLPELPIARIKQFTVYLVVFLLGAIFSYTFFGQK